MAKITPHDIHYFCGRPENGSPVHLQHPFTLALAGRRWVAASDGLTAVLIEHEAYIAHLDHLAYPPAYDPTLAVELAESVQAGFEGCAVPVGRMHAKTLAAQSGFPAGWFARAEIAWPGEMRVDIRDAGLVPFAGHPLLVARGFEWAASWGTAVELRVLAGAATAVGGAAVPPDAPPPIVYLRQSKPSGLLLLSDAAHLRDCTRIALLTPCIFSRGQP